MLNTVTIGDIGESVAVMKFTKAGCAVSKPLTNNVRYDLIVEIDGKLYRTQVKTTQNVKDGVKMDFATKTTNYTKGSWSSNGYTANEIDLFFLYCVENDWSGLFIVNPEEPIQQNVCIRVCPPKNNQTKGIRLAEDYSFDKQYASLTQLAE